MTALLVTLVGVLTLLVVAVAALALRLSGRIERLEARLAASSHTNPWSGEPGNHGDVGLDAPEPAHEPSLEPTLEPTQYVITHLGVVETDAEDGESQKVPTVAPGQFADIVLRETVIRSASLFHGVRRALSPENRNRIRFEMKREVKRSRKQRRADIREARREWEARQRAGVAHEHERAGSAA